MIEKGDGSRYGYDRRIVAGWKHLHGKHLKTTSEWPQSGPVTPLSSE